MATLIRRSNGVWYIVTCKNGKRKWHSLHTKDEAEARRMFEDYEREHKRRTDYRVSVFSDDFQKRAQLNLSRRTLNIYGLSFRNFVRLSGDKPMGRVSTLDAELFKQKRAEEVSAVTLNIELRTLKAGFNDAKRLKVIGENPFEGIKLARTPHKEGAYLGENDIRILLMAIDDPVFRDLIIFTVFTMTRRAEVVNLRWADVDFGRRAICVRDHGEFRVKGGKERLIPMCPTVFQILSRIPRGSDHVFTDRNGIPFNGDTLSRKFKRYIRKAELNDDVHFHSLRHSGISWLVGRGVPPAFVQRIAGHSSHLTTAIYTHYDDRNLSAAVNEFPMLI
jgi:integrase/recombinase XerD